MWVVGTRRKVVSVEEPDGQTRRQLATGQSYTTSRRGQASSVDLGYNKYGILPETCGRCEYALVKSRRLSTTYREIRVSVQDREVRFPKTPVKVVWKRGVDNMRTRRARWWFGKICVKRNKHPLCKQMIATYGTVIQQHRILCRVV